MGDSSTIAVIDGQTRTVNDPVHCGPTPNGLFFVFTGTPPSSDVPPDEAYQVGVKLDGSETSVNSVEVSFPDVSMYYYLNETGIAGAGDAAVIKEGNRYTITGHGAKNWTGGAPDLRPFEIEIACG